MLLYMTKEKQNNVLAAVTKDSEVMRLPWIIQVGPIDTHLYPYKQEVKGDYAEEQAG